MKKSSITFWALSIVAMICFTLPTLVQEGMFLDGVTYATIARNMAVGLGTFWQPHYTDTVYPSFHEHPSLAFFLESIFFRLLGDHLWVERIYSLSTAAITAVLIVKLYNIATPFKDQTATAKQMRWLPLFFWTITPGVFWCYSNNLLENTLGMFTTLAVYLLLKALTAEKGAYANCLLASAAILAGLLSKGIVALFPLAVPPLYWLVFRSIPFKKVFLLSLGVVCLLAASSSLILINDGPGESLREYFSSQVLSSLQGKREITGRFKILQRLFIALLPMISLAAIVFAILKKRNVQLPLSASVKQWSALFLLIGASASLPLMFSPKQRGFYLLPCYSFFAIGISFLIVPAASQWLEQVSPASRFFRTVNRVSAACLLIVMVFSVVQFGKVRRDKDMIADVRAIGKEVPRNSILNICPSMDKQWSLHAYFARYFNVSLDKNKDPHPFFLTDKNQTGCGDQDMEGYKSVPISLRTYDFYKRADTIKR